MFRVSFQAILTPDFSEKPSASATRAGVECRCRIYYFSGLQTKLARRR